MASDALIVWNAPAHLHTEKKPDWYWALGIITLALAAVAFIFGDIITGIFVIVAGLALAIHASKSPHIYTYEINDRGIMQDETLFPFLSLDSFCIPHDEYPHRLLVRSRKLLMPLIVIHIDEVDPESVRQILLKYIAETHHREPWLMKVLERFGF